MYGQNPQSSTAPPPPSASAQQPPPPGSAQQQPNQNTNAAKKGGSKALMYGIGIIVIVAIVAAIVLSATKPSSSNTLYNLISSNRTMSMKTFAQAVTSKYNSTSQLNISYSGLATINANSGGMNITMDLPMSIDLMKYNSNARVNVNVSKIPFLGNLTLAIILDNGEMYSCAKVPSSLGSFGRNTSSANSSGYTCQPPVSTSAGLLNSTQLNKLNGSIHFTSVSKSSYKGNGCVLTSGYMDINASNLTSTSSLSTLSTLAPTTNVNASFSMCLSDAYYVPLTLSMHEVFNSSSSGSSLLGSVSGRVNLQLNETSLSTSVSPSITTLPGPVSNTTTSGFP